VYAYLRHRGAEPWLDEQSLLAGQDWDAEIRKAVRRSHVVVVCLSKNSITREGYVQKELRYALDVADEKPEGTIFLIPLRIEACTVPERLASRHWVDHFEGQGLSKLVEALNARAASLGLPALRPQLPDVPPLTPLQAEILFIIWQSLTEGHRGPTMKDISLELSKRGMKRSLTQIRRAMESLEQRRMLERFRIGRAPSRQGGLTPSGFRLAEEALITRPASARMLLNLYDAADFREDRKRFVAETASIGLVDRLTARPLTESEIERQIEYCLGLDDPYIEQDDDSSISITERVIRERPYLEKLAAQVRR
jgi:hypothetical protein